MRKVYTLMSGNAFDQMAANGDLLGISMQIPAVMLDLRDTLDEKRGDVKRAAADREMMRTWADAAPETRAALLLSLAWGSRDTEIVEAGDYATAYAADLNQYARDYAGDSETFHGKGFPAMPLPGQAGALASSLGFDRDDVAISLETALVLLSRMG